MQPSWQGNIRATIQLQNLHGSNHLAYLCTTAVVPGWCELDSTGSGQGLLAGFLNEIINLRFPKTTENPLSSYQLSAIDGRMQSMEYFM
jgi:hypothetical protein